MLARLTDATLPGLVLRSTDGVALIDPHGSLTYDELADAVVDRSRIVELGTRSVVALVGDRSVEWIATYLGLLAAGHVPLLAGDRLDRLVDAWRPAAIVRVDGERVDVERRDVPPVELHPDLALLMSTSGSTGSPKLIRLSHDNLVANARSIAEFQALTPADRGITSLPLHYSLGLSVVHSHLVAGAAIVVTDRSVVDPCFAALMRDTGVTNLAGVPHTFRLIEQAGPDRIRVPSLRFLAQAGGRMEPAVVAEWAARTRRWGVSWYTMYGQTEATARISYVPPALAEHHPDAVGVAVPGGSITIDRSVPEATGCADDGAGHGAGEIVYRGPNVMLGYGEHPRDLALGRTVEELRTGDLGRIDAATGLLHVVGRRARHVKPFGLRIDLDDVERRLAAQGWPATVVGDDETLVAAVPGVATGVVHRFLADLTGLPERCIVAADVEPPRTASGKVDGAGLLEIGRTSAAAVLPATVPATVPAVDGTGDRSAAVTRVFTEVLGVTGIAATDTFVSLGGDSLSYVECSIRLESLLGGLPADWHLLPVAELARPSVRRRLARVDTTVLLRAIGILAVVSTHMRFRHVPGGAHLMLGVVGYNLARFTLASDTARDRIAAGLRTVSRVAVPTMLWTAAFMAFGQYTWSTLFLVNNYLGPSSHDGNHWHFWFVEVFVHLMIVTTLLMSVPTVRRADRRWPYAFPLVLLGITLTLRMDWADLGDWYNLRFRTHAVAWFFVLGWLVQRSVRIPHKLLTTVLCIATAPGVFQNPRREFFIAAGLVLLVWVREVPLPRFAVRPIATIAAASMWILISHFMIWPPLKELFVIEVAYPLTVLTSIGIWWIATRAPRAIRAGTASRYRPPPSPSTPLTARPAVVV